jgi:hypothetical protein
VRGDGVSARKEFEATLRLGSLAREERWHYARSAGMDSSQGRARGADQAESLSQPSSRLTGRHRTQPYVPDARPTLTCGYGLCRLGNPALQWPEENSRYAMPKLLIFSG